MLMHSAKIILSPYANVFFTHYRKRKRMLLIEKRRNVYVREAGTLGGRARDGAYSERARRCALIDPAFYVLASLGSSSVGRREW